MSENEIKIHLPCKVGKVIAVCRNPQPGLPKPVVDEIRLIAEWGIEGDYHAGKYIRHRYLARKDATRPNNRQVCLVDAGIFSELADKDIQIGPGMMGENITIEGLALMQLAIGTRLSIGEAIVELTEVRIPCVQLNDIDPRLMKATVAKQESKNVYKAGIMGQVIQGGWVRAGDKVIIEGHM